MSRDFAAMWRAESPQVRRQYEEAAEKRKAEHLRKYPGYRYQPARKRIAETKRRADAVSPTLRHHSTSPSASPMREATSMSQTAHQPAAERRPSPSERRPSSWALRGSGPEEATARTPSLAEEARWEYGDTFRRSAYAPDAHRGHHLSHDLRVDRSITYQGRTGHPAAGYAAELSHAAWSSSYHPSTSSSAQASYSKQAFYNPHSFYERGSGQSSSGAAAVLDSTQDHRSTIPLQGLYQTARPSSYRNVGTTGELYPYANTGAAVPNKSSYYDNPFSEQHPQRYSSLPHKDARESSSSSSDAHQSRSAHQQRPAYPSYSSSSAQLEGASRQRHY